MSLEEAQKILIDVICYLDRKSKGVSKLETSIPAVPSVAMSGNLTVKRTRAMLSIVSIDGLLFVLDLV